MEKRDLLEESWQDFEKNGKNGDWRIPSVCTELLLLSGLWVFVAGKGSRGMVRSRKLGSLIDRTVRRSVGVVRVAFVGGCIGSGSKQEILLPHTGGKGKVMRKVIDRPTSRPK